MMATKYKYIGFTWDVALFLDDVRRRMRILDVTPAEVGILAGASASLMNKWEIGNFNPKLENILGVCNVLDLDPRDYLVLEQ